MLFSTASKQNAQRERFMLITILFYVFHLNFYWKWMFIEKNIWNDKTGIYSSVIIMMEYCCLWWDGGGFIFFWNFPLYLQKHFRTQSIISKFSSPHSPSLASNCHAHDPKPLHNLQQGKSVFRLCMFQILNRSIQRRNVSQSSNLIK
jgi:hypothetical protein